MDFVKYDPGKFMVERAQNLSAQLGRFLIGESKLGAPATGWVAIPFATFTYNFDYTPDDNKTLIYGTETGTVSWSWWDKEPTIAVLYPGERVRASYDGSVFFQGIVDSTSVNYTADPEAYLHNDSTRRVDFDANCASYYATMMSKQVCWKSLPPESALKRVQRWVKVVGW